jgi:hypothetical protein
MDGAARSAGLTYMLTCDPRLYRSDIIPVSTYFFETFFQGGTMGLTAQILFNILCTNHNGGTIMSLDIIKT